MVILSKFILNQWLIVSPNYHLQNQSVTNRGQTERQTVRTTTITLSHLHAEG